MCHYWDTVTDGFGQSGIILLWHQSGGWEPLEFDTHQLPAKSLHSQEVSTEDRGFKQIDPGASLSWSEDLPFIYFDALFRKVLRDCMRRWTNSLVGLGNIGRVQ